MLEYKEYNSILYKEIIEYLKLKNERIDRDLFTTILGACRMVYTGSSIRNACELSGMGISQEHLDGKYISKYVRPIMKSVMPKLEVYEKKLNNE